MQRVRRQGSESENLQRTAQAKFTSKSREIERANDIDDSPAMIAQRKKLHSLFGGAIQRVEEDEPVQGKFDAAQRVEEEEPLQGKFSTIQRVEDEEPLQGKFGTAQRVEEEEPLQGKFDAVQRVEEEEPLQGKFATAQTKHDLGEEEFLPGKFGSVQRVEEEAPLQGKFDAASSVQLKEEAAKPNNTGLPDNLKSGIESLSGMSMDNVKVHYNSSQPAQLNALAYAQGTDIHVAPGQEQHLPHEAWHVVQQAQGRVKPTMQMKEGVPVNDDKSLEHEADVMGAKAMQSPALQRCEQANGSSTNGCATVQRALDEPEGFDFDYIRRQNTADQTRLIKRYLGSTDIMDKLSTLYGDAYLERMAQKREVVWWERFATYERLYGNWKGLIAGNVIDVDQAYDQFLRLQIAYYRLENRQNVVLGGGPNPLIAQIWSDMKAQFKRWDGTLTNRGAWWGSPGPGIVTGAIDIPTDVLHELVIKANASSSWRVEPSWSGGIGFHRTYNNIDFIYHAKKP